MRAILAQYRDQLTGKIIVDITNPLNETFADLTPMALQPRRKQQKRRHPAQRSSKPLIRRSSALLEEQVEGESLDVFIAGDDLEAKSKIAEAISAAGLRPIDVGPLRLACQLAGLGLLHIVLQEQLGTHWASTIKILP